MEQRRLLTFSVLVVVTWLGWFSVGPMLFPGLFPPPKPPQQVEDVPAPGDQPDGPAVAQAGNPDEGPNEPVTGETPDPPAAPVAPDVVLPEHPAQTVVLGSMDPATGYTLAIELTSTGAAVVDATLNDTRYPVAENPDELNPRPQLRLLGNNLLVLNEDDDAGGAKRLPHTFDVDIEAIDSQFAEGVSLRTLNWELLETIDDPEVPRTKATATFRIRSPDGKLEVHKIFRLNKIPREQLALANIRDTYSEASQLDVELQIRNLTEAAQLVTYVLQGPAGLPLENEENARKFRDIKTAFLSESGSLSPETLTAGQLTKNHNNGQIEGWPRPFRYIGVDTQYFAAILVPAEPQQKRSWFSTSKPTLLRENFDKRDRSDISVELTSVELELPPDGIVEHRFHMYLGPKRRELLEAYEADAIIDFGWFASISHVMVWLLDTFHGWGAPFGVAIIMLTVIVRGCMFPISKKQALSAKKMKDLAPQLAELREKFKDDKQKLAQAQMELYRKASFNPLAGCLPVFLQLPIFIALYQALNNWVDLRMAPFLWIDNLAAPDALTSMPELPFLGSEFNLLPLVTVCLFYAQQKMFMPPPTTDEMAMQQKMMNFMMIFFGFLFYHVPAGLCVYFIASSLWGMSERKLLEYLPEKPVDEEALKNQPPKKEGFMARIFKQLQEAAEMKEQLDTQRGGINDSSNPPGPTDGRRGGKRGGKRRR